jgi:hypothetical protein
MSQKQITSLRYFDSLKEAEEWLSSLVEASDQGEPYYLHIDHNQIFPANEFGKLPMITIYHRVYLQPGL